MPTFSALRPSAGVVARQLGDGAVVIQLESNRIYELNSTGARVWSMLEQGLDRTEICERLRVEFGSARDIDAGVAEILSALQREGLIGG